LKYRRFFADERKICARFRPADPGVRREGMSGGEENSCLRLCLTTGY